MRSIAQVAGVILISLGVASSTAYAQGAAYPSKPVRLIVADTPEQFAVFLRDEYAKWGNIIRDLNLRAE